jgi:membrane-associated protease RseP (regulator of RpoE activity)
MEDAKRSNIESQEKGDATGGIIPYKNVPALVSYYLGLFAVIPFLGILLGIAAFILGIIGLRKKKQRPIIKGTVHAWIGIICGFIFAMFWLLLLLLVVMAVTAS